MKNKTGSWTVWAVRVGLLFGLMVTAPNMILQLKPYQALFYGVAICLFLLFALWVAMATITQKAKPKTHSHLKKSRGKAQCHD